MSDQPPKQKFTIKMTLKTPQNAEDKLTEAKVKRWVEQQLKNCPHGTLVVYDVIEEPTQPK